MARPNHLTRAAANALALLGLVAGCGERNVLDVAGTTPLMRAAAKGDAAQIRALARSGEDVNYRGKVTRSGFSTWRGEDWSDEPSDGLTPLMIAARDGKTDAVAALVELGADVDIAARTGQQGRTALWFAAREGHIETVRALLAAHADPRAPSPGVAFEALQCGHREIAALLVRAGADAWDDLLSEAAARGDVEVVEAAVQSGPPLQGKRGGSALLAAAREGRVECVRVLLRVGVPPDSTGIPVGWTPLGAAAAHGREETVAVLLAAGAAADAADHPLHRACRAGHAGTVRILLAAGAQPDARDEHGRTPLFVAAEAGNADVVTILRGAGAVPERGLDGTLLAGTAQRGDVEGLRALLARGESASATLGDGTPALVAASKEGHLEAVRCLLAWKADPNALRPDGSTALFTATFGAHVDIVEALLEGGADVNARNFRNSTAVYMAARTGLSQEGPGVAERLDRILDLLLRAGADVNVITDSGFTPLAEASNREGREEAVRRLLRAGAAVDQGETTPLMLASWAGGDAICGLLLEAGADPNRADDRGHTALMRAAQQGHVAIVRRLLAAGADSRAANRRAETAESLVRRGMGSERTAESAPFDEILRLLQER